MTDEAYHEDVNRTLHQLLDNLVDLITVATAHNAGLAGQVRQDLENDGAIFLSYRPLAGKVEVSLGTADREPVILFEATPARKDSPPAEEPIN